MQSGKLSNYDKQCLQWAERFKTVDMQKIIKRLPEITFQNGQYRIRHFDRTLAMDSNTFLISAPEDNEPVTLNEKFNYYTLMWYCHDGAHLTGEWRPFAELKGASPFAPAFKRGILETFAETFSGKLELLEKAAKSLGAQRLEFSDCGFEIKAFECIPVRCLLWDADEEFHAQANMLFDVSITDFIHVESVVTIAERCVSRLAKAADVELKGDAFSQG